MKKSLLIFLTLAVSPLYSESPTDEEIPAEQEVSNKDSGLSRLNNEEGWPLFLNQGTEHEFLIRFPTDPLIEEQGKSISLTAVDKSVFPLVLYGFSFFKEPERCEDPISLFDRVLLSRSTNQSSLIWKHLSMEDDRYILDVLSKTKNLKVFRKDRIIVTAQNVYYFYTIFFPHSSENHDYFIQSFEILK